MSSGESPPSNICTRHHRALDEDEDTTSSHNHLGKNLIDEKIIALVKQLVEQSQQQNQALDQLEKSNVDLLAKIELLEAQITKLLSKPNVTTSNSSISSKTKTEAGRSATSQNFRKSPKVIQASESLDIRSKRDGISDKTVVFNFGPGQGQANRKLMLSFHNKNVATERQNTFYMAYAYKSSTVVSDRVISLNATIPVEEGGSETETNSEGTGGERYRDRDRERDRCDYFIHMSFIKDGHPTGLHKWTQLTTSSNQSGSVKSNFGTASWDSNTRSINFNGNLLNKDEYKRVTDSQDNMEILVTMVVMLHNEDLADQTSKSILSDGDPDPQPQPLPTHNKIRKLMELKNQINSKVTLKVGIMLYVLIHEATLRDSGSPILKLIFDASLKPEEKPTELSIPYLSTKAIAAFRNWVYGMDTAVLVEDLQLNVELLQLGYEYMICDLIQFCTGNILKILDGKFTVEFLLEVWKLEEEHKFPFLEQCVLAWLKSKYEVVHISSLSP